MLGNVFEHYDFISERIPESKRHEYFKLRLRRLLTYPQRYIYNKEVDMMNYSSIYYFEHIKKDLVYLIATQVEPLEKEELLQSINETPICLHRFNDIIYKILIKYELKDLVIPFFIWLNYYKENNIDQILENMEFLKNQNFQFDNIDELYNLGRGNTFFRLPYIEENNKEVLKKVCQFMRHICPDLNYSIKSNYKPKKKKRVGFISDRLRYDSSVLRDRFKIIENLDRSLFDVFIIVSENHQLFHLKMEKDTKSRYIKHFYKTNRDEFIFLPKSLKKSREIIRFLKLDILVYCEIGMDYKPYLLAYNRLAPIQINTWGHSETSGIDTIDHFISSSLYELPYEISKNYYSEKLILTESLCTCYPSLDYHIEYKTREELGFNKDQTIYCCLQASFKISEFMENVFKYIVNFDKTAIILLSIAFAPFSQHQLNRILSKITKKNMNQIRFFNTLGLYEYMNLVNISDIVLDTYPFGGCNSSLEAFYLNKPIVSLPSNKLSGRFTYGFYKKMDLLHLIAKSKPDYLTLINKLAKNKTFYQTICKKIGEKKHILFNDRKSIDEWNTILMSIF